MNNEFKRMQKLAGILTEGYNGSQGDDYVSLAMNTFQGNPEVTLTHGDPHSVDGERSMTGVSLKLALDYIRNNADASAIENGDIQAEVGPDGVLRINIGDQEFDIRAGIREMEKKKMTKAEAKKMIKDAILAEMAPSEDPEEYESVAYDYAMREEGEEVSEAKKDEEVPEEEVEEPAAEEDMIDADMEGGLDMDAGSDEAKNAFDELTDAYRSAKELGDEKLIRQLANTITYFNKNIILK